MEQGKQPLVKLQSSLTIIRYIRPVAATSREHAGPHQLESGRRVGVAVLVGDGRDGILQLPLVTVLVQVKLGAGVGAEGEHAHLGAVPSNVEALHHVVHVLLHLQERF